MFLTFKAYKKWAKFHGPEPLLPGLNYNQDQLFFINFAQLWCIKQTDQELENKITNGVHSPGEFRLLILNTKFLDFL